MSNKTYWVRLDRVVLLLVSCNCLGSGVSAWLFSAAVPGRIMCGKVSGRREIKIKKIEFWRGILGGVWGLKSAGRQQRSLNRSKSGLRLRGSSLRAKLGGLLGLRLRRSESSLRLLWCRLRAVLGGMRKKESSLNLLGSHLRTMLVGLNWTERLRKGRKVVLGSENFS